MTCTAGKARRFAKTVWTEHVLIEADTMEAAIVKIRDHSRRFLKGGRAARIDEVVLISHANAAGFSRFPFIVFKGRKGTTVEELASLRKDFRDGLHNSFQTAQQEVLALFDENTTVIVRACRIGRVPEVVDALTSFFGGQATVYASKDFAFTRRRIGTAGLKNAEETFDFLASQGLVPREIVATPEEKGALDPRAFARWPRPRDVPGRR